MNEKIRVILVEPGKTAKLEDIDTGLKSYQKVVDGYIQQVCPYDDPVAIICNEEGKIMGLPLNRALTDDEGKIYDIISGTFFICGLGEEDYISLSDELAEKYLKLFQKPEEFYRGLDGSIIRVTLDKEKE